MLHFCYDLTVNHISLLLLSLFFVSCGDTCNIENVLISSESDHAREGSENLLTTSYQRTCHLQNLSNEPVYSASPSDSLFNVRVAEDNCGSIQTRENHYYFIAPEESLTATCTVQIQYIPSGKSDSFEFLIVPN